MSCFCDYDPPEFYCARVVQARKDHCCYECNGKIKAGEKYEYTTGKWEEFDSFKTCERCHDLRQWVKNNVPCLCWAHGNILEDCENAIDEACWRAPNETAGLKFGFLRRRELIRRYNRQARAAA